MALKRLNIQNLRNLAAVNVTPSSQVNLFFGDNGSGKTSLLEAINVLTIGRSFRSHKIKPLINDAAPDFTVFGKTLTDPTTEREIPVGVSRSRVGESQLKLDGNKVNSAAQLAQNLPTLVINSDTFSLLEGAPKYRRQFLDWLVFHVEHEFYATWKSAQRCLKHRNSLLRRDRIEPEELAPWDLELALHTEAIHQQRKRCFESFEALLASLLKDFVAIEGLSISLYRGWEKEFDTYADSLVASWNRDRKQGYTGRGAHRADLIIRINGQSAADILSRGQQKLLVCALKIAQGIVFERLTQRKCVYLIDDLPAELDEKYRELFVSWLNRLDTQVFITGVSQQELLQPWQSYKDKKVKLFHVEQGEINESPINE